MSFKIFDPSDFKNLTRKPKEAISNVQIKNPKKAKSGKLNRFQEYAQRFSHEEGSRNRSVMIICREGLAQRIHEDDIRAEIQRFIYGDFTIEEAERVLNAQIKYHAEKQFVPFSEEVQEGLTNLEVAKQVIDSTRDPFTKDATLALVDGNFYQYESGTYSVVNEKMFLPKLLNKMNGIPGYSASTHKVKEVLAHIKSEVVYRGKQKNSFFFGLVSSDRYIAFGSTVLNMTKLFQGVVEQVPLLPNFFTTAKLPFEFSALATCPTFFKILDRILPDKNDQRMLQNWFGYHLLETIAYGKFLILMGSGANGKSVVLKILRLFLGEDNISSVSIENFSNQSKFSVAETHGKLGNIYDEMSGTRIDESYIKSYVTGGRVQCERKYEHPFTFTPTAKLTFATNVMPEIDDRSDAFWRRTMILKFNQTIPPEEQNPRFMEDDFWLSSGELAGIFNWAIQGAKDIATNNSVYESTNAKAALVTTRIESDNARLWISENLVSEPEAFLDRTVAYSIYKQYALNQSINPCTAQVFFEEIAKAFPGAVPQQTSISNTLRRPRGFRNIKLNTDDMPTQATQAFSNSK